MKKFLPYYKFEFPMVSRLKLTEVRAPLLLPTADRQLPIGGQSTQSLQGGDRSLPLRDKAGPSIGNWQSAVGKSEVEGRVQARHGFTLVEIMVTVALLSFIVLGLLSMFLQTQRAFRTSMTQTDVLETGRSVTDLLARELEQITPSQLTNTVNFYAQLSSLFAPPLLQGLPGSSTAGRAGQQVSRTNIVQNFFFLTQNNQSWIGTGYAVLPQYNQAGVGSLYRFTTNGNRAAVGQLLASFQTALVRDLQNITNGRPATNFQRVADGVVHARLRTFAPDGFPIVAIKPPTNGMFRMLGTNNLPAFNALNFPIYTNVHNTLFVRNTAIPDVVDCSFVSNAVPAYVEFELGILEPPILERYKSIGNSSLALQGIQRQFLSNHVAQVHLFRQRIAVRNVDFKVYQ